MRCLETIWLRLLRAILAACAIFLVSNAPAWAQACATADKTGSTADPGTYLKIVPETAWRPRGGEVWFQVSSPKLFDHVRVCFVWPDGTSPMPSPIVRRVPPLEAAAAGAEATDDLTITYAALVPDLKSAAHGWLSRINDGTGTATGLGTVPVAMMMVSLVSGPSSVVLVQCVGITSVIGAAVLVFVLLGLVYLALLGVARSRATPAQRRWGGTFLWLITGADHYASLSQFQIVLWTLTVAASAVYVMALSGNLLDLTPGVLILLGIASGAALIARVPSKVDSMRDKRADMVEAHWSDIVEIGGTLDVTRVQMLIFTMISAAFVVLKVVVGYRIPVIPDNFLLLMGISNGVYLTGRGLPDGAPPVVPAKTVQAAPLGTAVNNPPAAPAAVTMPQPLATTVNRPKPVTDPPGNPV